MTRYAGDRAVPAGQRKVCYGVIERLQLLPGNQAVAGLAGALCGARPGNQCCRELSLVWVLMARFACQAGKVVRRDRVNRVASFVAVLTRHGGVRSPESKARRLMILQSKSRRMKSIHRVAVFATVPARRAGELPGVCILVTVEACFERRMIIGIETGPHVALGAGYALVLAGQRVGGALMTAFDKRGRSPILHYVACGTLAVVSPALKLALVLVLVTVHAFFVG